jgi:tight adherence protein C
MTIQTWILTVVFFSVAGLTLGIGMWWSGSRTLGQRMGQISDQPTLLDKTAEVSHEWRAKVVKIASPFARLSAPKEGWEDSNLRVRFMQAGLRSAGWPVIFFSSKTVLALLLPGLFMLAGGLGEKSNSEMLLALILLLLAGIGYYLPNVLLSMAISSRQQEIREALPDAVDLMTVCVEAGLALDAALARAGDEMDLRSPALADELNLVRLELRVGATRENALRNFALRSGVEDVTTFVTMLLQSERFGTNVADSLRILAETMRDHRQIRAEETAAKIPVKLLFPLIFFIFPSLFLVLLGPAFISIFRTMLPAMSGAQ